MRKLTTGAIAVAAATLIAAPAFADRPPNASETAKLTKVLQKMGYVSWEEIEMDNDGPTWEIDDARKADGTRWDVKLSPQDLSLIKVDRED